MSGKLDRRDEVRFIAYLEANHYIPDNKKGSGGSHYKYIFNPDRISCRDQAQAEYYDNQKADKGSKTRFRAERIQMYSILIHCCLGEIH